MKIGFVACSARKLDRPARACDLYTGELFKLSRRLVEASCDRWYILSAKYGLLESRQQVEPYDLALSTMTAEERRQWAHHVAKQLDGLQLRDEELIVLAGKHYRAAFEGGAISAPLAGLGIGKQKQLLGQLVLEAEAEADCAELLAEQNSNYFRSLGV